MAPPGSWGLFIDEVGRYLTEQLGVTDDGALRTVLQVQLGHLPAADRAFPVVLSLPHDFVAWQDADPRRSRRRPPRRLGTGRSVRCARSRGRAEDLRPERHLPHRRRQAHGHARPRAAQLGARTPPAARPRLGAITAALAGRASTRRAAVTDASDHASEFRSHCTRRGLAAAGRALEAIATLTDANRRRPIPESNARWFAFATAAWDQSIGGAVGDTCTQCPTSSKARPVFPKSPQRSRRDRYPLGGVTSRRPHRARPPFAQWCERLREGIDRSWEAIDAIGRRKS